MLDQYSLDINGYDYRPLKKGDRGWDVYALQTALEAAGHNVGTAGADGILGKDTAYAIKQLQERLGLLQDSIAGVVTQRRLTLLLIWPIQRNHRTPAGLMRGQTEKESAFLLGNYTPVYYQTEGGIRKGPYWDAGVTQHSTRYHAKEDAFNTARSLNRLGNQLRVKYDEYLDERGVNGNRKRAWQLAAGSWNAPAWTDTLAEGGQLKPAQQEHIDAYIDRVTLYVPDAEWEKE